MMYGGTGILNGDTPLGVASVGGYETVLTSNYLFGLICDLQAKVDVCVCVTETPVGVGHLQY